MRVGAETSGRGSALVRAKRPCQTATVKVGVYELLGKVGEGGAGSVYRARAPGGETVALKLLKHDAGLAAKRFERERRLLAGLGEAHGFVALLDAGEAREGAFIVMPFLEGGTLRARLEGGPLPIAETVALGRSLARALGEAHARGVVHRDVKPENVIFTREGKPLLADLGLAKHFDGEAPGASRSVAITVSGCFLGTASYMAPEQARDGASAGPAADVFSLGAVLYECLAGEPAFVGETVVEILAQLEAGRVAPLAARREDAPGWLVAAIERALQRDLAKRPHDGLAFERALAPGTRRSHVAPAVAGLLLVLAVAALLGLRAHRSAEARARFASGLAAYETRSYARARDDLERACALDPELLEAQSWRVIALCRLHAATLADAEAVLARDPGHALAWVARADVRSETGDLDGAIADASRAIELDPAFVKAWSERAFARNYKGDFGGAEADATRAIEMEPGRALLWSLRGATRLREGDIAGALADTSRSLELDPSSAETWDHHGIALGQGGDLEGQIADDTKALALAPKLAVAWGNRGNARGRRGDAQGEIADQTMALGLDPGLLRSWVGRARAHIELHEYEQALSDASRAIAIAPGSAEGWAYRGVARRFAGDLDGSVDDLTHAVTLDPSYVHAWRNRAVALASKGDYAAALADESRVLELTPGATDMWLMRGSTHDKHGDAADAIADFEKFIELRPDDAQAPQVRQRIAELRGRR